MYTTILVACISAIAAIGIYVVVTNLVTKNSIRKRREAALKEAEAEGEMIKRSGSCRQKRSSYSLRANTTGRSTNATRRSRRANSGPSRSRTTCRTSSAIWRTNSAKTTG